MADRLQCRPEFAGRDGKPDQEPSNTHTYAVAAARRSPPKPQKLRGGWGGSAPLVASLSLVPGPPIVPNHQWMVALVFIHAARQWMTIHSMDGNALLNPT